MVKIHEPCGIAYTGNAGFCKLLILRQARTLRAPDTPRGAGPSGALHVPAGLLCRVPTQAHRETLNADAVQQRNNGIQTVVFGSPRAVFTAIDSPLARSTVRCHEPGFVTDTTTKADLATPWETSKSSSFSVMMQIRSLICIYCTTIFCFCKTKAKIHEVHR